MYAPAVPASPVLRRLRALALVLAVVTVAACPRPAADRPRPPASADADLPYELADDGDLAERRDLLWSLAPGPERAALRLELARALAERARGSLRTRRIDRLEVAIESLSELWFDEPAAMPVELAAHRELLLDARAAFARAGADQPAALTVVLLAAIDPAAAADHRAELELILSYADDLTRSRHGELATGTGAIDVLAAVNRTVHDADLIARQVTLLVERANRADASLASVVAGGARPSNPVYRMALHATFDITLALALHHRAPVIADALIGIHGLGRDRRLLAAVTPLAGAGAGAVAWADLAAVIRDRAADDDSLDEETRTQATRAALAVCLDGLVRFPDDPTLLAAAATHAAALDRIAQPIALYERARAKAPDDRELARRLADLYRDRLGRLGVGGRPRAAAARLDELRAYLADVTRAMPEVGWKDRDATALATYGRALAGLGRLDEAKATLRRSNELVPNVLALEMLGTIAWKKGDDATARKHLAAAIELGGQGPADRYARAKLLRLSADVAAHAGDTAAAHEESVRALEIWADLGRLELPPPLTGERLVESARLLWSLGREQEARDLFAAAMDADPDGADTATQTVTFLLTHDDYDGARDAYYQVLASDRIGDYFKVYIGLWILAEGRRRGAPDDRITSEHLRGRDGPLWFDDVARAATGRLDLAALAARATTLARRTEVTFYAAALGLGDGDDAARRRALADVVASDMVLFFEYDLARSYLARPARGR